MSASPLSIRPRDLLRIAVPISLGSLVQFFVVLTDNFFLSRAGELELNAAGNAALVYLTFVMVLTGGSMGIQILVARHQGTGQLDRMALASRTGRVALVVLGAMLTALVLGVNAWGGWEPLMANEAVRDLFTPFLAIRGWGFVPYALSDGPGSRLDWTGQNQAPSPPRLDHGRHQHRPGRVLGGRDFGAGPNSVPKARPKPPSLPKRPAPCWRGPSPGFTCTRRPSWDGLACAETPFDSGGIWPCR